VTVPLCIASDVTAPLPVKVVTGRCGLKLVPGKSVGGAMDSVLIMYAAVGQLILFWVGLVRQEQLLN
jgi:hypothetical protein